MTLTVNLSITTFDAVRILVNPTSDAVTGVKISVNEGMIFLLKVV